VEKEKSASQRNTYNINNKSSFNFTHSAGFNKVYKSPVIFAKNNPKALTFTKSFKDSSSNQHGDKLKLFSLPLIKDKDKKLLYNNYF